MMECLILGDSIGNGIASAMPDCARLTEIGITSDQWYHKNHNRPIYDMQNYRYVVISLGTNDTENTSSIMRRIRKKVTADRVIWVLPSSLVKPAQRANVERTASEFGDWVLSIQDKTGRDQIHPATFAAYQDIARRIKDSVR